ncbi:MAG TPA: S24 family peptidase [Spirochaetota bacterium]|nr:S24 family peptidase [Spirochaetota bacterium]
MKKLHFTQKKLLELLRSHQDDPLTVRDLQQLLDISSPSVVHHHIQQLEKKGYLRRNPHNPRDYQILTDQPDPGIVYLHLYGLAECGPGSSILDNAPLNKLPLSSQLLGFPAAQAFLIKAKGDSMQPRIHHGDIAVVCRQQQAPEQSIIVCTNEGHAYIKQLHKNGNTIILHSLNSAYTPFIADPDSFKIEGVVRGVFSYL